MKRKMMYMLLYQLMIWPPHGGLAIWLLSFCWMRATFRFPVGIIFMPSACARVANASGWIVGQDYYFRCCRENWGVWYYCTFGIACGESSHLNGIYVKNSSIRNQLIKHIWAGSKRKAIFIFQQTINSNDPNRGFLSLAELWRMDFLKVKSSPLFFSFRGNSLEYCIYFGAGYIIEYHLNLITGRWGTRIAMIQS